MHASTPISKSNSSTYANHTSSSNMNDVNDVNNLHHFKHPALNIDIQMHLEQHLQQFNLSIQDFYQPKGLAKLDQFFLEYLQHKNPELCDKLQTLRMQALQSSKNTEDTTKNTNRDDKVFAEFLCQLAPYVENFIAELFDIQDIIETSKKEGLELAVIYNIKRLFVQRRAVQNYGTIAADFHGEALFEQLCDDLDLSACPQIQNKENQLDFDFVLAKNIENWQILEKNTEIDAQVQEKNAAKIDTALRYCAWRLLHPQHIHLSPKFKHLNFNDAISKNSNILFKAPKKYAVPHLEMVEESNYLVKNSADHSADHSLENLIKHDVQNNQISTEIKHYQASREHLSTRLAQNAVFDLTDPVFNRKASLDQSHYCIHCHAQNKDSCAKGLKHPAAKIEQEGYQGIDIYKKNTQNENLQGCPLEERISEFHWAKSQGYTIAALGLICIDNPMAAATGHRICNDCMKSCIYQKQTPVDIPQAETETLRSVMELPWGFEIYGLLTRWNPLNINLPYARENSGREVLIVGAGPAGYTLAHHLLNCGHQILLIDALKIEPMPPEFALNDHTFNLIYDIKSLQQNLSERTAAGFGGVSEYGITIRWDKNFLNIIRLLLERRPHFNLQGGVRFGGEAATIDAQSAFAMGFDHIALAMGAGQPRLLDVPQKMPRGVRTASDFLMSLQSTSAFKKTHFSHLQIQMPIVVVGGGLTAIDCATESLAYYIQQVEKFYEDDNALQQKISTADFIKWCQNLTPEEQNLRETFLAHAQQILEIKTFYKNKAQNQENAENAENAKHQSQALIDLIKSWGGIKLVYRKGLEDSPAYRLNIEEVQKALEEGIEIITHLEPQELLLDESQHLKAIDFKATQNSTQNSMQNSHIINARTLIVAAGTQANITLSAENPEIFKQNKGYFQTINLQGEMKQAAKQFVKTPDVEIFTHFEPDQRAISFIGDLHPSFFGNVVKAMASAKKSYPLIDEQLKSLPAKNFEGFKDNQPLPPQSAIESLLMQTNATVQSIQTLAQGIVEIVIHAPQQAKRFQPGQFYRLQNFEYDAPQLENKSCVIEPLALTGAWVDRENGLIACIALLMGTSSQMIPLLKIGQKVSLMGPTGTPSHIPKQQTVLLIGGGLGNAVLFSIAQALKANGCRVIYFAGYKKAQDRYYQNFIENHSDSVIWCCDEKALEISQTRQGVDYSVHGNMLDALNLYLQEKIVQHIPAKEVDEVLVIGSDRLMAAMAYQFKHAFKAHFKPNLKAIASINSPMQCMMKEICGQCIQAHILEDGRREYLFSCVNQDQNLLTADFQMLNQRLMQNSLLEKQGAFYLKNLQGY